MHLKVSKDKGVSKKTGSQCNAGISAAVIMVTVGLRWPAKRSVRPPGQTQFGVELVVCGCTPLQLKSNCEGSTDRQWCFAGADAAGAGAGSSRVAEA